MSYLRMLAQVHIFAEGSHRDTSDLGVRLDIGAAALEIYRLCEGIELKNAMLLTAQYVNRGYEFLEAAGDSQASQHAVPKI